MDCTVQSLKNLGQVDCGSNMPTKRKIDDEMCTFMLDPACGSDHPNDAQYAKRCQVCQSLFDNKSNKNWNVPIRHFFGGLYFKDPSMNSKGHVQVCTKCRSGKTLKPYAWHAKLQTGTISVLLFDADRRWLYKWTRDELMESAKIYNRQHTDEFEEFTIVC